MNFFTVAQILAIAAAQNTIEWSTFSFYSSLAGDYQCLLPWLPDSDATNIASDPSNFIKELTASPATYYAGLLGLTTGCVWSNNGADATATATAGSDDDSDASFPSEKSDSASSHPSEAAAPVTDVASANRAAVGVAGAGAMAAAFFALV